MEEPLIQVKNLKKYFDTPSGYLHAVDGVSFQIEKGKTLGVVGESGCGKSTLGRLILNLIPATEGEVLYKDTQVTGCSPKQMKALRHEMQLIFQDPYASLNPRMTVSQAIAHPMKVNGLVKGKAAIDEAVAQLMDTVGLAPWYAYSYPHELDGGRRQRIGIARALALNPSFIVCDEPVSALDVSIQAQILNLLMDLQDERGLTYMFITHNLSVVKHISDDIAVMYLGQCVEKTSSRELFKNPLHPYTKALLDSIPVPVLRKGARKKRAIAGELVSPINPPAGCRFAPRCPFASEKCTCQDVPLKEVEPNHFVKCVLF